jgi:hypothetical protein
MPKKSGSRIADEIGYRLSILAGAAGWFAGFHYFRSPDTQQVILLSTGLALAAMFGTAILLKFLLR